METEYDSQLFCISVRWLSSESMLIRFERLLPEIIKFLEIQQNKDEYLKRTTLKQVGIPVFSFKHTKSHVASHRRKPIGTII